MTEDRDRDDPPSDLSASTSTSPSSPPEERYRKIFQYNNDAVMVVDLETKSFLDVNPAACDLLGDSREELLSMHPEDIHPNDVERVREEFISQVYQEGSGFTDDLTCLTKDGEEVPTEISGAALDAGEDGNDPTQMIAMLCDISDRVEHRREVAAVGTTELEYMEEHGTCSCRTVQMADVPRAKAIKNTDGLVQIVKHHETDEIVGVHMVGSRAADMIMEATLAVKFKLTVDDIIDTVHPFPTFSEAFKQACQAFRRDVSTTSCCIE